jgi:hypothetical protein
MSENAKKIMTMGLTVIVSLAIYDLGKKYVKPLLTGKANVGVTAGLGGKSVSASVETK